MPWLPRTEDFEALIGTLPADAALWVPGDVTTTDPSEQELGQLDRWALQDYGAASIDGSTGAAPWFVCRTAPAFENLRLIGRFHWRHVDGERQDCRLGLLARWQGDSTVQAGPPPHWLGGSCYALKAAIDATGELASWTLSRYDAGIPTTLDTGASAWPIARSAEIELRVVTANSGSVRLQGFAGGVQIVDATDPALTALTGGRIGFRTEDALTVGGETRTGIRWIKALRVGRDDVQIEDDFARPNRVDEDPGYHLRSLWAPIEGLEVVGGALAPVTGGSGVGRFCTYQVHPWTADYRATAVLQFADAAAHWGGVFVRGSKAAIDGDLVGFTGYLARLRVDVEAENLQLLKVVCGKMVDAMKVDVPGLLPGTPMELRVDVSGDIETKVVVRLNGSRLLQYTDELADRHTRAGQAGVYLLSATSTAGVSVQSFVLKDDQPEPVPTIVRRFDGEFAGLLDQSLVMADLSSQITATARTFRLPVVPASTAGAAVFWNGLRVRNVSSSPTALQCSVDLSVPSIYTGFSPRPGDSLLVDVLPAGVSGLVVGEVPGGTINGTNKAFTLAATPLSASKIRVFVEGVRLRYAGTTSTPAFDEYSVPSAGQLRVGTAPRAGGQFCIDYATSDGLSLVFGETPTGDLDGVNRVFTLAGAANSAPEVAPFVSGLRLAPGAGTLRPVEYSLSGDEVTLGINAPSTAWIVADYVPQGVYLEVLDLVPDEPVTPAREHLTDVTRSSLGYEWTVPIMASPRSTYPIKVVGVSKAKRDYVIDFFDRHVGPWKHFLWLPPDEDAEQRVHLAAGSFKETKLAPDCYSLELTLEQLKVEG